MQLPLQLTFRDVPESQAIEQKIREKAEKLNRFYDRIMSCHVMVKLEQKHQHQGKLYAVHINLVVPHGELVVNRVADEDLYVAIRDAFKAARRQLEAYAQKHRGQVKVHESSLRGEVVRLSFDDEYGFIAGDNGTEYYFSMTNVLRLDGHPISVGDRVEFYEVVAGEGPQAVKINVI